MPDSLTSRVVEALVDGNRRLEHLALHEVEAMNDRIDAIESAPDVDDLQGRIDEAIELLEDKGACGEWLRAVLQAVLKGER